MMADLHLRDIVLHLWMRRWKKPVTALALLAPYRVLPPNARFG